MNELPPNPTSFGKEISHTAYGVAYRRTFTNIPFAQETFEILERVAGPLNPVEKARADGYTVIIPEFEARYFLTDIELRKSGVLQVLELASGLAPRGLMWSRQFSDIPYVELDLLSESLLKRKILGELVGKKGSLPRNLFLQGGDAKNPEDFEKAAGQLDNIPVGIVCEGLLRYMNWPDKDTLAKSIRSLLERKGGVWVTPDIELLSDVNADPKTQQRYEKTAKEWGLDIRPNLFRDMGHAFSWFESFGFTVDRRSHLEVIDLLHSPRRLDLNIETVCAELAKRFTFVLSL